MDAKKTMKKIATRGRNSKCTNITVHNYNFGASLHTLNIGRPVEQLTATPPTTAKMVKKPTRRCYRCHTRGHTIRDCPAPATRRRERAPQHGRQPLKIRPPRIRQARSRSPRNGPATDNHTPPVATTTNTSLDEQSFVSAKPDNGL